MKSRHGKNLILFFRFEEHFRICRFSEKKNFQNEIWLTTTYLLLQEYSSSTERSAIPTMLVAVCSARFYCCRYFCRDSWSCDALRECFQTNSKRRVLQIKEAVAEQKLYYVIGVDTLKAYAHDIIIEIHIDSSNLSQTWNLGVEGLIWISQRFGKCPSEKNTNLHFGIFLSRKNLIPRFKQVLGARWLFIRS